MTDGPSRPTFGLSPAQRAELAALLAREGLAREDPARVRLRPDAASPAPLSGSQERIWFLEELAGGTPVYNVPAPYRLEGPLDLPALRRAIGALVRRHDVLRASFRGGEDGPRQIAAPPADIEVPVVEVSGGSADERFARALALVNADYRRPFDLAAGPPFRAGLWRLGPEDHVLLLAMHHIASDAKTVQILAGELASFYAAFRAGAPPPLAPRELQYADYAVWQRGRIDTPAVRSQIEYWKGRLAGEVPRLALPADRPRPAAQSLRGAWLVRELPPALLERLEGLARARHASLFMLLLASFQALLFRYTRTTDIAVGSPVGMRSRLELEDMPGFFVNTLVLRTDLAGNPTVLELLDRVRETALGAFAHQEAPFERVVDAVQPARDLSHTPLFQVMFDHQAEAPRALDLAGLRRSRFLGESEVHSATAKVDIALRTAHHAAGTAAAVEYDADLFDAATMARLLEHYEVLLTAAAAAPETRLADLPLLTPAERQRVVVEWNATAVEYPRDETVHGVFARRAGETPAAPAIEFGAEVVSYAALDARANRLAHHLRAEGVRPGDNVALCVERSPALIEAMLGILKAGAAYVPLDPGYPTERISFLLADCAARALVTQETLRAALPAGDVPLVLLDTHREAIAARPSAPLESGAGPDHAAYVIYTSGSTGTPKGVAVPHRGVLRLMFGTDWLELDARVRMIHLAPISFDASVLDIWGGLLHGGCIVPFPERVPSVALLRREIAAHAINTLFLTTALFDTIVDEAPDILAAVRQVATGGEAMSLAHLRRQQELLPYLRVTNCYGPTEASVIATRWHAPCPLPAGLATAPIGTPIGNTTCYVLDEAQHPVPIGIPGELCLGGPGVALGYLGRPELTAERFVPDPFTREAGARLYRTGDRARWRPDGNLEFLGRDDDQVKIRGHRIELGEIEATLGRSPEVRQALAVAIDEERGGGKRLAAYVVPAPGAKPTPASLAAYLRARSPEYLVPAAFVVLDALPLTAGGKVDRRALPAPAAAAETAAADRVAPRNEIEEILAAQWAEVLELPRVGVHDDFFRLGGHSLLATVLGARISRLFGVDLPLRVFFQSPTVAAIGTLVARERAGGASTLPPIPHHAVPDGRHSLSLNQKGLWFVQRLTPDSPFYNVPVTIRLRGPLDVAALERSLREIVRRHEALRTTFRIDGGEPRQVVSPPGGGQLQVVEVEGSDREAEAGRMAAELGRSVIDLERGPVFRARLARLGGDDAVLAVNVHHLVFDGWSMDVFVDELVRLYEAFVAERPSPLAEPPIQYADFARWQRDWLRGEVWDEQLRHWREKLAGAAFRLELPADHPRPAVQTYAGTTMRHALPPELASRVRDLGRGAGTTVYMTMLAAAQVLLWRYTDQIDFTIGTPVAGRARAECERAIGLFLNIVVLRADLSGDPTFAALLQRVREQVLSAHAHQDFPFEGLVEALQPERDLSYTPIYQVLYSYRTPGRPRSVANVEFHPPREIETNTAKTDLSITVDDDGEGLAVAFTYNTDLFAAATTRRLARHLESLLASAVAAPDRPISALAWFDGEERRTILAEWRGPEPDFPRHSSVVEIFERQVDRTPGAIAVRCRDEAWTYRQLDRRANRIANHLIALGVSPGTRVAMCIDRSADMVAAALAILKAGGAYVPLDPTYPDERLAFMIEDTGAPVLLTHESMLAELPRTAARVVGTDTHAAAIEACRDERPAVPGRGDSLAYVIYTSGSTGRPKGVLIPQRAILRLVFGIEYAALGPETRILALSPISFDASTFDIWGALLRGGTCVVFPERVPSAAALTRAIAEGGVTTIFITTALFNAIVDESPQAFAPVKQILTGGEKVSVSHVMRCLELHPALEIRHVYGPTECTTFSTWHPVARDRSRYPTTIPIGRSIGNTPLYVLDRNLAPVGAGVPGELYIGGPGLAVGYLNRPELTAERFVPDPFSADPTARLYRTGDVVRWLPGGEIEFRGRNDDQVKIRGHRIELGEIQAVLAEHDAVQKVYVTVHDDPQAGRRLVAYLVPEKGATVDRPALEAYIGARLPEYMIPRAFTFLDDLPINPNGKVDRTRLPAPQFAASVAAAARVSPRSEVERHLLEIWRRTLGVKDLGVEDDFFELGGHSLLAVKLLAEVNDVFGMDLPLASLIAAPTIASQAQAIYQGVGSLESSPLVKIRAEGARPPVFCVCSIGGTVLNQRPLAMRLGADQPFYGLQAVNLDEALGRPAGIEDYAARYIEAMREAWPAGPYVIGGHSFGGVVSYEIAQQLRAAGAEVAMLFILDSALPNLGPSTLADRLGGLGAFLRGLPHVPAELAGRYRRDPAQFRRAARQKLRFLRRRYGSAAPRTAPEDGAPVPDGLAGLGAEDIVEMSAWPENNRRIARRHWRAVLAYAPAPYPGVVTLFRSRLQSPFLALGYEMGWNRVARAVEVLTVPGSHLSILDPPHVDTLARKFRARLER
ncbi:MAG: amino acid adenylation domain-containing protein [Planctomycetota bacterium]